VQRQADASAPVFVDATGRRRRWLRRAALAALAVTGAYTLAVGLSFLGGPVPPNALLPLVGVPARSSAPSSTPAVPGSAATTRGATARPGGTATATSPVERALAASSTTPSPSASPSPSGGATGHRPTAPPGQVGKSATATASGHGR